MALGGIAREVAEFSVDQVAVPLRVGVETSYAQVGHQPVNFLGGQDASLARRHHLHNVGPQTGCCLRQPHISIGESTPENPALMDHR